VLHVSIWDDLELCLGRGLCPPNNSGQGFLKVWFKGTPRNFEAAISSKTCKIIPKRIVYYYSIGSHSAQLVLLYLQKFQHKYFTLFVSESIGFLVVTCRF